AFAFRRGSIHYSYQTSFQNRYWPLLALSSESEELRSLLLNYHNFIVFRSWLPGIRIANPPLASGNAVLATTRSSKTLGLWCPGDLFLDPSVPLCHRLRTENQIVQFCWRRT